jgi:hypothetical protein
MDPYLVELGRQRVAAARLRMPGLHCPQVHLVAKAAPAATTAAAAPTTAAAAPTAAAAAPTAAAVAATPVVRAASKHGLEALVQSWLIGNADLLGKQLKEFTIPPKEFLPMVTAWLATDGLPPANRTVLEGYQTSLKAVIEYFENAEKTLQTVEEKNKTDIEKLDLTSGTDNDGDGMADVDQLQKMITKWTDTIQKSVEVIKGSINDGWKAKFNQEVFTPDFEQLYTHQLATLANLRTIVLTKMAKDFTERAKDVNDFFITQPITIVKKNEQKNHIEQIITTSHAELLTTNWPKIIKALTPENLKVEKGKEKAGFLAFFTLLWS